MGARMGKYDSDAGSLSSGRRTRSLGRRYPSQRSSPASIRSFNSAERSNLSDSKESSRHSISSGTLHVPSPLSSPPALSSTASSTSFTLPNFRWIDALRQRSDSQASKQQANSDAPDEKPTSRKIYDQDREDYLQKPGDVYAFPPGVMEADRLDQEHYLYRHIFGTNALVSLPKPNRCLDIGCGTGIWLLEMAADYPWTQFVGVDIATHHPDLTLPSNVTFQQGDVMDGLPFSMQSFDYIHVRMLATGIHASRWISLLQEIFRVTSVGGFVEIVESDYLHHRTGPAGDQINAWIQEITLERGMDLGCIHRLETDLEAVGFTDIECEAVSVPTGGGWGGTVGQLSINNYESVLRTLTPRIRAFGVEAEEVERIFQKWRTEVEECQSHWNIRTFVCRRPLSSAS